MMNNAWRMNEGANKRWNDKGWGNQYDKGTASNQGGNQAAGRTASRGGDAPARSRQVDTEVAKRSGAPRAAE